MVKHAPCHTEGILLHEKYPSRDVFFNVTFDKLCAVEFEARRAYVPQATL